MHNFLEFSSPLECLYQVIQTQGKVFYCFYQINFQNKKRKTLCYGTDQKRNFYQSRGLVREACMCIKKSVLVWFSKKMLSKKRFFSLKMPAQAKRNWHSMFLKIFQVLADYEMVNKVNLSSFSTQNLFQIRAWLMCAQQDNVYLTYSHANTPLGQSERAYYLSYFQKILLLQKPCRHLKLVVKATP